MAFYNCHIHIFTTQCAPDRFLEVALPSFLDPVATPIKGFLETRFGRFVSKNLARAGRVPLFKAAARYARFASIGTNATQQMVFENVMQYYPPGTRFVILTLNMDHMGAGASDLKYQGQIDQVIQLRRMYPDTCLPFLSIDPRMGDENELLGFVEKYVGRTTLPTGEEVAKPFVGIKLYPALGFFPYDKRFNKVYEYCSIYEVPIMTHCTPSGAYFVGQLTAPMGFPETIHYGDKKPLPVKFIRGNNDRNCDVFLYPKNWETVLLNYPKLKVCFAHMGGLSEIWDKHGRKAQSWLNDIMGFMETYANIYTDISYTLADESNEYRTWKLMESLLNGTSTKDRILFGTDYFMTEQEDSEKNLAIKFPRWLLDKDQFNLYRALTEDNPKKYLESKFFKP